MDISQSFLPYFDEEGILYKPSQIGETDYSDGILFKPSNFGCTAEAQLAQAFELMDIENTNIFSAVKRGDVNMVSRILALRPQDANKTLVFRHKDVIHKIESNITPLIYAAQLNYITIAKILILHRAQVNAQVEGWTPLMFAAAEGNAEMADLLVQNQADLTLANNYLKVTALMVAASNGHNAVVDRLIKYDPSKVHITQVDKKGRTAIAHALRANRVDIAQKLMATFFDVSKYLNDNSVLSNQNERPNQVGFLQPLPSNAITTFLNGMTMAFHFAKQQSSTPIKPLFTKEEWRKFEKDQRLKELLERCKTKKSGFKPC